MAAAAAQTYTFAPLPLAEPDSLMRQFKPVLSYLERRTNLTFKITYVADYASLLSKFRAGEIDLIYLGPLPYVELRDSFPAAEPLVHFLEKNGKARYTCSLIAAGSDSGKPVPGKTRVALTQPLSTCGYLSVDMLLRERGGDLEQLRYRYLGKHDEVALSLARGDFELGGLKTAIARRYEQLGLRILQETPEYPSFSLIANAQRMPLAHQESIRKTLTGLRPLRDPVDAQLTATWGDDVRYGAIPANDRDFAPVRQLLNRQRQIPERGNF